MSDPPAGDDMPAPSPVDVVIDLLGKRAVDGVSRQRLGDALDRANRPQQGRAGADAAVGRVTR